MNVEKTDFNHQLISDEFIQDQTQKPEKVNVIIHPEDGMYLYALKNTDGRKDEALLRYFSNGKRILDAVKQIVEWYFDGFENISSFLDFASGYGRFSRFLLQEIPTNKIWVSDIYPEAVEFQKQQFGVEGIVSTNYPEDYQINQKFDCIFTCSFFGHTPQKTFTGWLEKLYSSLTENGILIFSTHDLSLMTIETDVEAEEIYFISESESLFQKNEDSGVTYVGEKWVGKIIQKVTQGKAKWHRIKRGLCGHHDLYIIRKKEAIKSNKEEVGEQIDELLNFHCHPDGGCQKIQMTATGDIYLEGWAADINPEEKVEKISFLINGNEVGSCFPEPEIQTQKYKWSCLINTQNLSVNDIILVKIINNFHWERVVKIYPIKNIALLPPNDLLLRISGNPSIKAFISSFDDLRYTVKNYLQTAGFNFNQFEKILDFGCGVGRYLMAFEPELLPNQKLFGCDVFAECAEWCQENIKFATVKHNDIQPPLPFESNQFDLINAISVFTHLSLDLQHLWAWDIYRVLRPGGILFMTLHGPQFFPIVYDIFRSGNSHKAAMYSIGEEGLFLYLDHQGETDGQGQHTIAAVHTPAAYKEIFSMFKHIKRFPQSNLANGQDLYILQKPISGSLVAQPLNIKSGFTSQNLELNNFAKTEDVENATEEIIGNISSELPTQNWEVNNFAKTEDMENTTQEIIGNISSELPTQNWEVNNFTKTEDVGNAAEEKIRNISSELLTQNWEGENLSEKILSDSHQYQTEMKFQIEGQKQFRAYPQIEPIGNYSIGCKIKMINNKNGEVLVQKSLPLNNKNIFGKTNYGVIEVEIPEYSGELIVRLSTVIIDRMTLPARQEVLVSWNFANFA